MATRFRRLTTLSRVQRLKPLRIDDAIARSWAELRLKLRDQNRRMAINDSWIAAMALTHGLPVATQDDNFDGLDSLEVIKL